MGQSRLEVLRDVQQLLLQLYPDLHHAVLPVPWGKSENKWCMENCVTAVCVKVILVDLILVNSGWTWWDLLGKGLFHGTIWKVATILSKVVAPANPQQPMQQSYCHTPGPLCSMGVAPSVRQSSQLGMLGDIPREWTAKQETGWLPP